MPADAYGLSSISFVSSEERDIFCEAFHSIAKDEESFVDRGFGSLLSKKMSDVYSQSADFECEPIFDASVVVGDENNVILSLEGSAFTDFLHEMVVFLGARVKGYSELSSYDYEYGFTVYDSVSNEFSEYSNNLEEACNSFLRDDNLTERQKLFQLIELCEKGLLIKNKSLFEKLSDPNINPWDDGYIHAIYDVLAKDENGENVLTTAVRYQNIEVLNYIIDMWGDEYFTVPNDNGELPIKIAESTNNKDLITLVKNQIES